MAISKIILNGVTQMDVTQDTVTTSTLLQGETAHDASGTQITGTASGGITPTGTINISTNGVHDVTNYASANVSVSGGGASWIQVTAVATSNFTTYCRGMLASTADLDNYRSNKISTTAKTLYLPEAPGYDGYGLLFLNGSSLSYYPMVTKNGTDGDVVVVVRSASGSARNPVVYRVKEGTSITLTTGDES